jgi:hypothetical protein
MESLTEHAKLLGSIWSYRGGKRKPNGDLIKHKACICVDGRKQAMDVIIGIHMPQWCLCHLFALFFSYLPS